MILEGLALGGITVAGASILYKRMPVRVQKFCQDHPILMDICMAVAFYELLGFTLVAHFGAAFMTLFWMFYMEVQRNPNDYQFLSDIAAELKTKWQQGLGKLKQLNEEYKAYKARQIT